VFVKDRSGYWHDPECWNKVVGLPKGKNVTPGTQVTGKVIIVRTVEWSVTATATENGAAVATAAVACEANGSSASATSSSRSEYSAAASATASGSTREEATQNARNAAAAKALQMNLKSTVEGMAKVKAEGQAVAAAAAEAHCTGQPPASYVCPPGTTWNDDNGNGTVEPAECKHPGTIDMMEDVNDVVYGNSRTIRVTGTIPDGQAATLKSYAGIGTIAPSDQVKQVSGSFDILIRYTAPTEGTSDTVTVKLYSPQGVLWDQKSDSFGLGRPVTPQ
jgi:hypothetical protein